jgi:hypothetical protein
MFYFAFPKPYRKGLRRCHVEYNSEHENAAHFLPRVIAHALPPNPRPKKQGAEAPCPFRFPPGPKARGEARLPATRVRRALQPGAYCGQGVSWLASTEPVFALVVGSAP